MHTISLLPIILLSLTIFLCCSDSSDDVGGSNMPLPTLRIADAVIVETEGVPIRFTVSVDGTASADITVDYSITGITATPQEDYTGTTGSITIPMGTKSHTIEIVVIDDELRELDETFRITLQNPKQATLDDAIAIGMIRDEDAPSASRIDEDGYFTVDTHYGYTLSWSDEFAGVSIDAASYNFEMGDGCPNLCGWGNNELQHYSADAKNAMIENGKLILTAIRESLNTYSSARITTKGKHAFRHGRIDIRARVPSGQGIWPALWMLGANIDAVGWPACGEIDIMEMVGGNPNEILGTAHWGASGGPSTFVTGKKSSPQSYSDAYHVYTLDWTQSAMTWYIDEQKYHTIPYSQLAGQANPFNGEFFFIFNIAVGGNLPGPPDASTAFPVQMEIDYVRVFQLEN